MNTGFTRRDFLKTAGILLAGTCSGLRIEPCLAASPTPLRGYPRTFAFRQTEILANLRSYDAWEKTFLPFSGLIGKLLQEERTDTVSASNLDYFTRFKLAHPDKAAILHFNGHARLPWFETSGWFAGWWLHYAGSATLTAVDATADLVPVSDLAPFPLQADGFGNTWADLVIAAIGPNGKPDFSIVEQVRLLATDATSGTLQVQRGCYGTSARAWPAGSHVAPHVTLGPLYRGGDKVWFYNLATSAPRSPMGLGVIDAIMAGLQTRFAAGGDLAFLDGMELDAFSLPPGMRASVDADGDGIADQAMSGRIDLYTCGQIEWTQRLRAMLGPNRWLIVDGGGAGERPDPGSVNGVECEGVPTVLDVDQLLWSQALSLLAFERAKALPSALSYGLYKFNPPLDPPARFARFRMALAASLLTASATSFYDEPVPGSTIGLPPGPNAGTFPNVFTIWDEIRGGADIDRFDWLGAPAADCIHPVESMPDLYRGAGIDLTPGFIDDIGGSDLTITRHSDSGEPYLQVTSTSEIACTLPAVSITGSDLTLIIEIDATTLPEYPPGVPRFVYATAYSDQAHTIEQRVLVDNDWNHLIVAFRRVPGSPVRVRLQTESGFALRMRRIKAIDGPDLAWREYSRGAVFVNPSDASADFDLASILPGRPYRRIRGSTGQDPAVNNGSSVQGTLVLPPIDALVLARADVYP